MWGPVFVFICTVLSLAGTSGHSPQYYYRESHSEREYYGPTPFTPIHPSFYGPPQNAPHKQRFDRPAPSSRYDMRYDGPTHNLRYNPWFHSPTQNPYYNPRFGDEAYNRFYDPWFEGPVQSPYYYNKFNNPAKSITSDDDDTFILPTQRTPIVKTSKTQSAINDLTLNETTQSTPKDMTLNKTTQSKPTDMTLIETTQSIPTDMTLNETTQSKPTDLTLNVTTQSIPNDLRFDNNTQSVEDPYEIFNIDPLTPKILVGGRNICDPFNPPVPDFIKLGRRPSDAACENIIWGIRVKEEQERRDELCGPLSFLPPGFVPNIGGRNLTRVVVKGVDSEEMEFPHMGALGWKGVKEDWKFKCGSTLISSKFILTAAHCTESPKDSEIIDLVPKIVRFAAINIVSVFTPSVTDVNIGRIIRHPDYKSPTQRHDIALMELETQVKFTDYVKPACLWSRRDISSLGSMGTVTGWGVLDRDSNEISAILQAGKLDIIDNEKCNTLLQEFSSKQWNGVTDNELCAGSPKGVDTSVGDSGGPMQVKVNVGNTSSIYYVIGVTAFGFATGVPNIPGVYTRVSSYIDWIEGVVWPGSVIL